MSQVYDLLAILAANGFEQRLYRSTGKIEWIGPCPFCQGGDDRFSVWPDQKDGKGKTFCRKCPEGERLRDGPTVIMHLDGMKTYREFLNKYPEFDFQKNGRRPSRPRKKPGERKDSLPVVEPPCETWRLRARAFVDFAHSKLLSNKKQLAYLESRGIAKSLVVKYTIGFNPGESSYGYIRSLKSWGLPEEKKPDGKPKKLWLPIGIVIPLIRENEVIGLRLRKDKLLSKRDKRYKIINGSRSVTTLYGNQSSMNIFMVEADLDAIALAGARDDVCSYALGSLVNKPDTVIDPKLKGKKIFDALDFDIFKNQREFNNAETLRRWWRERYKAEEWPVPAGKDVGEYYAANGDLSLWMEAAFDSEPVTDHAAPIAEHAAPIAGGKPMVRYEKMIELLAMGNGHIEISENRLNVKLYVNDTMKRHHWNKLQELSSYVYHDDDIQKYISLLNDGIYTASMIRSMLKVLKDV